MPAPSQSRRPPAQPAPVGYGLIGPGVVGRAHLARIERLPGARVVAVAGRSTADVEALLAHPDVNVVLVAAPHLAHAPLAISAFAAGKHVLVEKPLAHRLSDARAVIAAWRSARRRHPGLRFGVMFQERLHPVWIRLRELLAARVLGRLMRVTWIDTTTFRNAAYFQSAPWRGTWAGEGGGLLINQAVHKLDLYACLFGRPDRVHSFGRPGKYHAIETEDDVTLLFEHTAGLTSQLIFSTSEFPGSRRLEIVGEHGRLAWENGRLVHDRTSESVFRFIAGHRGRFATPGSAREEIALAPDLADPHFALLADFTAAVRDHLEPAVPGPEGEASVELVNASLLALHGGGPVSLPLDAPAYDAWLATRIAASASA